jgi:hypothetical protein
MWVLSTAACPSIRPRVSANESRRRSPAKKRSIQVQISIGHAVYREALRHCRPAGGAIDFADTADRIHGSIDVVDQKPVTPGSTSSGIDPRLEAMTGVPQASASTTDSPNGSSKFMKWSSAQAEPRAFVRAAPPTGPR